MEAIAAHLKNAGVHVGSGSQAAVFVKSNKDVATDGMRSTAYSYPDAIICYCFTLTGRKYQYHHMS